MQMLFVRPTALLPSFHPESDPQGFKALRQAYESALQEAKTRSASGGAGCEYAASQRYAGGVS